MVFAVISCSEVNNKLLRLSDGKIVTLESIVNELKNARLVFVGELHAEKSHHDAQLAVIRVLSEAGIQVAIGLEMFRHENQEDLDKWIEGMLIEEAFQKIYYDNWNYPWSLYRDIFIYARQKKLPLIGLNVPSEITRQVSRKGFASLTKEQLGQLPEVTCDIDEAYMDFVRRVFGAHSHGGQQFVHFCEAQMVWDASMAWYALSYLDKNPESTIVVLAGSGHAWRRGIPKQVRQRSEAAYRIIIPTVPGKTDPKTATIDDSDYIWLEGQ
jgi:uncharacterized iron-regulated protein